MSYIGRILSVESERIGILINVFERLVEVREQEIYEPGVSAEKIIDCQV